MFSDCDLTNLKIYFDPIKAPILTQNFPSLNINCNEVCNNGNIYYCKNRDDGCPIEYNNLIREKGLCIKSCEYDDYYKYKYNNICYNKCPAKTKIDENNEFLCTYLNCPFYYNYEQNSCIEIIPEGYFLNDPIGKTIDLCNSNCQTCERISTNCISCNEYYYYLNLDNNKCESCHDNCKK